MPSTIETSNEELAGRRVGHRLGYRAMPEPPEITPAESAGESESSPGFPVRCADDDICAALYAELGEVIAVGEMNGDTRATVASRSVAAIETAMKKVSHKHAPAVALAGIIRVMMAFERA